MKKITIGKYALAVGGAGENFMVIVHGPNLFFYRLYPRPRTAWHLFKLRARALAAHLQLWPVYFEVFRRDCDLCESTSLRRFPCYTVALWALRREADEWTEGPFNYHQLSRREAKNFKAHWRDRIGEAFDDGKGTRVIL